MRPRRLDATLSRQLLCLLAKTLLFAVVCSGFIVGSVRAQYYGLSEDIVFPGPISTKSRNMPVTGNVGAHNAPISRALASRINSIDTIEEFLELLQGVPEIEKTVLVSKLGGNEERSNAERTQPAKCIPELKAVSLKMDNDPKTIVYPSCTRIKRCGGCCASALLSCQPTATETRNFEVVVSTLSLSYRGRQIVPLEEHTACKCDCRIKEEHCSEKQHYDPDNCMCVCENNDEREKCMHDNDTRIWDPDLCTCSCRKIEDCNTGYYFDHNTCRCRQITFSRPVNRFAPTKGSNYNFDNTRRPENAPPVIIPLDASDPRRKPKEDPEYK
ncbi:PREDICTED: uncharacterized protein LOC106749003 [Dinoponera quadriceps]|uniref:Uncharacterized protein LOC106749003 n=1 Tax=Dinoponera quadriceps TaxID=609295 RepID=A0A6P3XY73_DINQU|nr:PREDICTED: uncharacterized protein LOC106749003 [Dinoponera quadriceps]